MQLAFSYMRFSREHQGQGDSLRRQTSLVSAYCASRNLQLDDRLDLKDLGVSGYTGRNLSHGALGRFVEACERGLVPRGSALVIEALDRLSRQSPRRTVTLLNRLLDEFGIEVHLVTANRVFKPDAGEDEGIDLILAVAMAIEAHRSSAEKATRLQHAWSALRKKARETHAPIRKTVPWWLTHDGDKITAPKDRAAAVHKVYLLTSQGFSSAEVARRLNAAGVETFRPQKAWTSSRVRDLVRSLAPEGFLEPTLKTRVAGRAYEPIANYYPRVVSPDLAAAARATLKENRRGSRGRLPKGERPTNLLRGILRHRRRWCRFMVRKNGHPDPDTGVRGYHGYYECVDEAARPGRRMLFCYAAAQLEPILISALAELTPDDLSPRRENPAQGRATTLRGEVAGLREKQKNLLAAVEAGSTAVAKRLVEIEADLAKAEAALVEAESAAARPLETSTDDLRPLVGQINEPAKRELAAAAIRRLISRITVGEEFGDLYLSEEVYKAFLTHQLPRNARKLPDNWKLADPTPIRGRKPLWIHVEFKSGAHRLIARATKDSRIISLRIEPDQVTPSTR